MSGSQRCESLFFAFGGKEKRLREKAAQNNQISEKTSLLVKKTLKNLYNSKKSCNFELANISKIMKAIFINGSPRKNKNTAQMLEAAMKGAQDAGVQEIRSRNRGLRTNEVGTI